MTVARFAVLVLAPPLAALLVAGCAPETKEVSYDSHSVAVEAGAFKRGWLPTWLPASSTRIVELHNIDTNARMWKAEAPVGVEVGLPLSCTTANGLNLPRPPFEPHWWPNGVPYGRAPGQEFIYFKCGAEFVGLAAAGGKIVGWAVQ